MWWATISLSHLSSLLRLVSPDRINNIDGRKELIPPASELAQVAPVIALILLLRELQVKAAGILHGMPLDGSRLLLFFF